ncbi:hypothetical protein [Salipiger bermudensis]|uniref:hypothetical protein n=1 Tax=Salipiger bermudensis TaxID=344736 RepID=UPI001CD5C5FD|nr:hypothetical protein [Salipiger bermudensis]MCA1286007.1 hypothetical protein [Salipiger bermudensis]
MIRIALFCTSLWLCAGAASAQEIRVRSGEHGSFTRLALDIPDGLGWQTEYVAPRRIELRFDGRGYRFDSSDVFARINTERLSGLDPLPGGAGLALEFGCDCVAEAFLAEPGMLVLDIRPGEPPQMADASGPMPEEKRPLSGIRVGPQPGIGPSPARNPLLPVFVPQRATEPELALPERIEAADRMDPAALGRTLAEQLATAASDGLLSPSRNGLPQRLAATDAPTADAARDDANDHGMPVPELAGAHSQIEAAILGREPADMQTRVRIGGTGCVADGALDIASWGTDETFDKTIPELRRRLYGEFDTLDPEILTDLVRAHVYIGFGAEARALLELLPDRRDPVLYALAGIVDGGTDRAGVFAGQTGCEGAAALWALAGAPELPEEAEVDDRSVRRAFEALPATLRPVLGPTLATRLAEAGHSEAARNLLSRLARSGGASDAEMRFSQAQIDRLEGAVQEAHSVLEDLSHGAGAHAPDAVAATIALASENGAPVNARMTDLSAAYSTELRATEKGPELWLAHLRALAANDRFEDAFEAFRNGDDMPEEHRRAAASELLTALSAQGADTGFLQEAVPRRAEYATLVQADVALTVARRLLGLGLADEAMAWASLPVLDRESRERRLLLSEIHLARSDPQQAEIALIGLQGDDALALRAQARAMMGDYSYAQTAFGALGEDGAARSAAWLAGDWAALGEGEDALAAAAELLGSALPDDVGPQPSLAVVEALATSGAETRDTLRALLEQTRLAEE